MTARTAAVVALTAFAIVAHRTPMRAARAYRLVEHWAQLPAGTTWGVMSWVSVDAHDNVYAFQREEPTSKVLVFDRNGRLLRTWGDGQFAYPHSLRVLRDGFVWLTDRKSQQLFKFAPDGTLRMSIGKKDVAGDNASRDAFNGVSDVVMAPDGTLFVSDGEGGNTRVVKLAGDGTFLTAWGTKGSAPGQLSGPHCVAMDSAGRVYVCDRGNKRIQVFDRDGTFLSQLTQFGTPVSIAFDRDDTMFVAAPAPENKVTIGSTAGKVLDTIEGLESPHGIAVDSRGAIYVAESAGKAVLKYARDGAP
ncbi:MAG TPA: peptidyl-alpha-hydroxyglycine alpha-amidating lyase family protein [Vicinamibacterales bacterium]|nr:peptidyl-alpha-hydroxyglycine alpha-amidating lyase family protein [Vicinamibacterales bacterium]